MNGYSKMKTISDTKSRSMDFLSDLLSLSSSYPETQNHKPETLETYLERIKNNSSTTVAHNNNNMKSSNRTQDSFSFSVQEEEGGEEEDHQEFRINYDKNNHSGAKFGEHVKLSRNSTVSASSATSHALQSAVKRVFSMRRSSSISERYRRIHDQSVTLGSPIEDEHLAVKKKKKSSKSKIIKSCKKLFGL